MHSKQTMTQLIKVYFMPVCFCLFLTEEQLINPFDGYSALGGYLGGYSSSLGPLQPHDIWFVGYHQDDLSLGVDIGVMCMVQQGL